MKKLIVLLVVAVLATVQVFANDKTTKKNSETTLRNEIVDLLDRPQIEVTSNEIKASIEFILNTKGEIVILTVDTERSEIENYVKSRLNYQKIDFNGIETKNKVFKFNLKILSPGV